MPAMRTSVKNNTQMPIKDVAARRFKMGLSFGVLARVFKNFWQNKVPQKTPMNTKILTHLLAHRG